MGLFLFAVLAQWLWWRIRPPRRQTRALLLLFLASYLGAFVFFWFSLERGELLFVSLLYLSLVLGYVITYSAIEVDSPTLVLIDAIAKAGEGGLDPTGLEQLDDSVLVTPRIDDLIRDHHVAELDGRLTLLPKGRRFVSVFVFYRWLLRRPMGG